MGNHQTYETEVLFGAATPDWVYRKLVDREELGPYQRWTKKTHKAFAKEIRRVADNQGFVRGIGVGRLNGEGRVFALFELSKVANKTPFVGSPDLVILFHPQASLQSVKQEVRRLIDLVVGGGLPKDQTRLLSQTQRAYDLYMHGN